jgi:predicted SAM-dependent methyltransferase
VTNGNSSEDVLPFWFTNFRSGESFSDANRGRRATQCSSICDDDTVARIKQIVFDCEYPSRLARFWSIALDEFEIRPYDDAEVARLAALGYTPETDPTVLVDGPGMELCFQLTNHAQSPVKQRIHLDLSTNDLETNDLYTETQRLVLHGATIVDRFAAHVWMSDPEGNDFCITQGPETPVRVIIGAGAQQWDGWVATQQHELDLLVPETFHRFFNGKKASALLCEHTWEHLTIDEGIRAARTCFEHLVEGGRLRVAVPDGRFPDQEYQRNVQVGGPGPPDHQAAGHQVVFVAETLADVFTTVGFEVTLLEWWDRDGVFHVENWQIDDGPIYRSSLIDHRNEGYRNGTAAPGFTSLIIDAVRPQG